MTYSVAEKDVITDFDSGIAIACPESSNRIHQVRISILIAPES